MGEASTAGFAPGEWPPLISVVEENLRVGIDVNNVYRLEKFLEGHFEQVMGARYVAAGLPSLHILNT